MFIVFLQKEFEIRRKKCIPRFCALFFDYPQFQSKKANKVMNPYMKQWSMINDSANLQYWQLKSLSYSGRTEKTIDCLKDLIVWCQLHIKMITVDFSVSKAVSNCQASSKIKFSKNDQNFLTFPWEPQNK